MPTPSLPTLTINAQPVPLHASSAAPFASFLVTGPTGILLTFPHQPKAATLSPQRHGLTPQIVGNTVRLAIPGPIHLLLEIDQQPLFLFAEAPDPNPPSPSDPNVLYFPPGDHSPGEIRLTDNQTLYLAPGALVKGRVYASSAHNIRIAGLGILDASPNPAVSFHRCVTFDGCSDITVEGITLLTQRSGWMLCLGACSNATIRNTKQLGADLGNDGIDLCGCSHVRVENCFLSNGDDNVVIKAADPRPWDQHARHDWRRDVSDILVTGCQIISHKGGCATEIGHETRTDSIANITFRDLDILGVHDYGSAFGIHTADRATISHILYENIRVEHHYDKLIDFRIIASRWGKDGLRGHVRDITLRNIDVTLSPFNPGYTCSLIGGYDEAHRIQNVHFENFRLNATPATNPDSLDLYTKHADNITFTP